MSNVPQEGAPVNGRAARPRAAKAKDLRAPARPKRPPADDVRTDAAVAARTDSERASVKQRLAALKAERAKWLADTPLTAAVAHARSAVELLATKPAPG